MFRNKRFISLCVILLLIPVGGSGYLTLGPGRAYVRAASLLQRISDGKADGTLANLESYPVDEQLTTVDASDGPIPARLYVPRGAQNAPGMVLLHGVHHLSIDEPRLVAFSRAVSSAGIVVLTPALKDIADYHVSPTTITTIGSSIQSLSTRLGGGKVGGMGPGFARGLALIASADPRYADSVGFVVSIGGHHDLARVCEFFATDKIALPDGTVQDLKAHEYGALVVVYSHPEDFFSAKDVPAAREAIRYQLWENEVESRKAAEQLSPAGRARMELLWQHKKEALSTDLAASIERHRAESLAVSPRGNLAGLRAPVLLLHGVADNVIPASETLWLQKEVRAPWMRGTLITPLLSHVDVASSVSAKDKWEMVSFMAELLRASDTCVRNAPAARPTKSAQTSKIGMGVALGHAG